ncbi:SHOCT domain-containing protein [Nocardioides sp. KR10-350]|uniref:SHOCT domain-containing protein n=1 Tax=Nocardioides cheoyonin TaxID=3156615 RepID=UPI0032B4AD7F
MGYLEGRRARFRSRDDRLMRAEVNLGMTAFTGSVIATVAVQPEQAGCRVSFSGRMGVFSQSNIGAQRRIEDERTKLFSAVGIEIASWPDEDDATPTGAVSASRPDAVSAVERGLADQLAKLADLHAAGILTDDEFTAAKARLLS